MRALIVGFGTVGRNLSEELWRIEPDVYDRYMGIDSRFGHYDVAFVCVDTPNTEHGWCDLTEVKHAISANDADVYVIRSTVLPGTTRDLSEGLGKRVVFSPEYYGSTQHNASGFDFTILGGRKRDCVAVQQLLQEQYDGSHRFVLTDSRTAELAKYMENAWIATKVSFCDQFFDIAESMGVCYEELRELFVMDPRVSPSHTYVPRDAPYWDSHCLNKDVPAIAETCDAPLLKAVVSFNEKRKM